MMKQSRFGVPFSATAFKGLNANPFVCWNIPVLTHAHAMSALAKFAAVSSCN